MGYDHSLNSVLRFKSGVSKEQVFEALTPLAEYLGFGINELFGNELDGDDTCHVTFDDEGFVKTVTLYTCGEVGYGYSDLIEKVAENLCPIAEADYIELRDHDTGDLENAISYIWYGADEDIAKAKKVHAWNESAALLRAAGIAEEMITAMGTAGGFSPEGQGSEVPVWHWDSKAYNPASEESSSKFAMEIVDQRSARGQAFVSIAPAEGNVDTDMLCATFEVNRLMGSKDESACLHLCFDEDNVAASFFKKNDKFIVRLEKNVMLLPTRLPCGDNAWILNQMHS